MRPLIIVACLLVAALAARWLWRWAAQPIRCGRCHQPVPEVDFMAHYARCGAPRPVVVLDEVSR